MSTLAATSRRDAAVALAEQGIPVVPMYGIRPGGGCTCNLGRACEHPGKHPRIREWTEKPLTDPDEVREFFDRYPDSNLGILTGKASGLWALDVDARHNGVEALRALEEKIGALPRTLRAKSGGGGEHILFRHAGGHVKSPSGRWPGIDIRGDGAAIVVAPSVHASGRQYEWAGGSFDWSRVLDAPADLLRLVTSPTSDERRAPVVLRPAPPGGTRYGREALRREAARVAAAPEGTRNATLNRAAFSIGTLIAAGEVSEEIARHELTEAARAAGKQGTPFEVHEIAATLDSGIRAGMLEPREVKPARRQTRGEASGERVPFTGKHDQDTPRKPQSGKRRIEITLDMRGTADQGIDALVTGSANVYQRAQSLVSVVRQTERPAKGVRRAEGAPIITRIGDAGLLECLTDVADWIGLKKQRDTWVETPKLPPRNIRDVILARCTWPGVRWLEGVISAPTIRSDGSILDAPGYDATTGLLFDPEGVSFPPIKGHPTRDDVRAALLDLAEPCGEFPYADQNAGLSASLAAVLSIIGRHAYDGPAPMFGVRANTPGSGKGLLVDAICITATGRAPARMTLPQGREADNEMRKRCLSLALEGDSAVLVDNIDGRLGSATLAAVLTASEMKDRVLGENRTETAPLLAVWFATGNGLVFRGDLGRRVVPIDLDPMVEHPEDRKGPRRDTTWRHPDLLAYVRQERPRLVSLALTVLRGYHVAGRPGHVKAPKGSFEGWDALVRGALIWAGLPDPLDGCETIRQEGDQDLDVLRAALACWREAFEDRHLTATEAVNEAKARAERESAPDPELLTALAALADRETHKLDGQTLGTALGRVKGRIGGGLRFKHASKDRKVKIFRWGVEVCD